MNPCASDMGTECTTKRLIHSLLLNIENGRYVTVCYSISVKCHHLLNRMHSFNHT